MLTAVLEYHTPTSVDEAIALLCYGGDGKTLAGGQSLMPLLNFRARPAAIIDLSIEPRVRA
jgi:carbon-monoxide dehydrogenase medium subunit